MSDEPDPDVETFARRRRIELAEWREILIHGTDEEKQALVASLREVDIEPLLSTLELPEDGVRIVTSQQRTMLALQALAQGRGLKGRMWTPGRRGFVRPTE